MPIVKNMSSIDRFLRTFLGLALVYLGFFNGGLTDYAILNILIGLFGLINVVSSIIGACPVYTIAGISSCKKAGQD